MPPLIAHVAMCLAFTVAGIMAYDRVVVRPATAIGVVDAVQIYREKESQLLKSLSAGANLDERARVAAEVRRFAERLPLEMAHLADDCACLIVDRSVVIGMRPGVRDMTPMLRERVLR